MTLRSIYNKSIFFCLMVFFPLVIFAISPTPFGGRITTVKTPPNVACATDPIASPFYINPVAGLPGPWSAMPGPVNVGLIVPNAWILGLLFPGPGSCVVPGLPPTPFPTATTNFYGTSFGF